MLAEEAKLAAQVLYEHPPLVRGRVHVRCAGVRDEEELPAGGAEAVGPIGLLAEEEERLVGRTDLGDGLAPDEPDRTHQHLRLAHGGVIEGACIKGVERLRARRELAQIEELRREAPQRRE